MEAGLIASLLGFCYIELQFPLHNFAGPGVKIYKANYQLIHSKRHILSIKSNTWRLKNIFCNRNESKQYINTWQIMEVSN